MTTDGMVAVSEGTTTVLSKWGGGYGNLEKFKRNLAESLLGILKYDFNFFSLPHPYRIFLDFEILVGIMSVCNMLLII
jgi:hypothetical protein